MKTALKHRLNRKFLFALIVGAVILPLIVQGVSGAVTLVYFIAEGHPDMVDVEWETASEVDMAGFYVLRSGSSQGEYLDVSGFILSVGDSLSGSTYNFVDQNVVENQVYYYKLQVVDNNQTSEYYGPVMAYSSQFTLTPSPTGTATTASTGTVTPGGNSHTPTPTLTNANKTATATKTRRVPSSIITATIQQLAMTRTPTFRADKTAATINDAVVNTVTTPAPDTARLEITPRATAIRGDQGEGNTKAENAVGWLFVGIGAAGLLIGGGWLIWAINRQKSTH